MVVYFSSFLCTLISSRCQNDRGVSDMADDDDWIVLHASPGDPGARRRRQSPSSCDSRLSELVVLEALPAARPTDSMEGARFLAFDNDAEEESTLTKR